MFQKEKNILSKKELNCYSSFDLPMEKTKKALKKSFLLGWTKHALNLFVRQNDIKNFTKLVLSDPKDLSHNDLVNEMLPDADIIDEKVLNLTDNEKFLRDLNINNK